jgi:hypothetical protein
MEKLSTYERECKAMREDMHDKLKVIHKRTDEILEQVKLTNGRVSNLESWKDQFMGGLKVAFTISALLAFFLKMGWLNIG